MPDGPRAGRERPRHQLGARTVVVIALIAVVGAISLSIAWHRRGR